MHTHVPTTEQCHGRQAKGKEFQGKRERDDTVHCEDTEQFADLHGVDDLLQLNLVQDLEALLLRDLCQLEVVMVEFLLHHLLQHSQRKNLSFQ